MGDAQGCPWDEYTCANAALGGHLAVPQWARQAARERGHAGPRRMAATSRCCSGRALSCPWDERTCSGGAWRSSRGAGRALRAAHGTSTRASAAGGGHLDVLQWARAQTVGGTSGRAFVRLAATSRCCSGRCPGLLRANKGEGGGGEGGGGEGGGGEGPGYLSMGIIVHSASRHSTDATWRHHSAARHLRGRT